MRSRASMVCAARGIGEAMTDDDDERKAKFQVPVSFPAPGGRSLGTSSSQDGRPSGPSSSIGYHAPSGLGRVVCSGAAGANSKPASRGWRAGLTVTPLRAAPRGRPIARGLSGRHNIAPPPASPPVVKPATAPAAADGDDDGGAPLAPAPSYPRPRLKTHSLPRRPPEWIQGRPPSRSRSPP